MDALNTVFILFLFLGPGLLIKAFTSFITISYNIKASKHTIYEHLLLIVVHSVIVTGTTIGVINILSRFTPGIMRIETLTALIQNLSIIKYSFTYLILSLILCVLWFLIFDLKLKLLIFKKRNEILNKRYGVTIESADGFSVWESLIYKKVDVKSDVESKDEKKGRKFKPVVSVYKDGNYVTSGFLDGFNDTSFNNQELELVRTRKVDRALKNDEDKDEKDKLLSKIEHEYFDFETGVVIKFHNSDKLIKHWKDI